MSIRQPAGTDVEVDGSSPLGAFFRKLLYAILFAAVVGAGTFYLVSRMEPLYRAGATVLIVPGESDLVRTDPVAAAAVIDREAIGSQMQLIRSRDLARAVAARLDLASHAEFDPARQAPWPQALLSAAGFDWPATGASGEERVLAAYFDRLSVYPVDNSRVIAVDFLSMEPALAAEAANAVVDAYVAMLRAARQESTSDAVQWLTTQIEAVRAEVQEAEARVERYRADNDLFSSAGPAASTLPQQQLSDLNAELGRLRAVRAGAEAKALQVRALLAAGGLPSLAEVLNAPLIQRLIERRVTLRAERARLDAELPAQHARMVALVAEIADLDRQIAGEAARILQSIEAEARLAADREAEIERRLSDAKAAVAEANDAAVGLRALEREAAAQRDLLDSYLARYRDAVAREETAYLPADARIVSRAAVPIEPDFPKIAPLALAATGAALFLALAFVLLHELAGRRRMRRLQSAPPWPFGQVPADAFSGQGTWADDRAVRRIMPKEPTLVPEMVDRVEDSIVAIAGDIVRSGKKRVLVTLAEGSDGDGRPLGAVALARALARTDARVVLVDFRGDGANTASMGEGDDIPGFSDLFAGEASFAQVIFRDRRSRVHFIPAGRKHLSPARIDEALMETVLSALTLTYDYVLLDAGDDMIPVVGPACGAAVVVSEHGAADRRTRDAAARIREVSDATVMLLVVDPLPVVQEDDPLDTAAAGAAA